MLEVRDFMELVRLSEEDLAISSYWRSLAEKLSVSGRIYLLEDMSTDSRGK